MLRINRERMRLRRIELGFNAEKLAEKAGLDARTVRRIEHGRSRTRLRSAVGIAKALNLEVTALVLDERSGGSEPQGEGGDLTAALTTADGTIQRENVSPGEWSLKVLYALSLLTRTLVLDGKSGENEEVDRVVAAFKAADGAIRTTLSRGGEWGAEEVARVMTLLLSRYGTMLSDGTNCGFGNRRSGRV